MRKILTSTRGRQSGMSLLAAIFVLLLLSSLAAGIVSFSTTAHVDSAQDFEGSRAYQAARAGVEWGLYQLDPNAATSTLPICFAATTRNIPGYSVEVSCTIYPVGAPAYYQEGTRQIRMFLITARAISAATFPQPVEREIAVTVEKCRDSTVTLAPYDC